MAIIDKIKKAVSTSDEDAIKKEKKSSASLDKSSAKKEKPSANTKKNAIASNKDLVYYRALKAPYVTEKSSAMMSENKYVFEFSKDSNKIDIKKAIESLFNVTVLKVSVMNTSSKRVRLGRHFGRKSGIKKAIITLKEGDKIDIGV